jgi:hypothetical protein
MMTDFLDYERLGLKMGVEAETGSLQTWADVFISRILRKE